MVVKIAKYKKFESKIKPILIHEYIWKCSNKRVKGFDKPAFWVDLNVIYENRSVLELNKLNESCVSVRDNEVWVKNHVKCFEISFYNSHVSFNGNSISFWAFTCKVYWSLIGELRVSVQIKENSLKFHHSCLISRWQNAKSRVFIFHSCVNWVGRNGQRV